MRPAVIGTLIFLSAAVSSVSPASAFQSNAVTVQVGGGHSSGRVYLGAPLYAGPGVIIIERGGGRYGTRNHIPGHRHGVYRGGRYTPGYGTGYAPYPYTPFQYGNRSPLPRLYVTPPRHGRHYTNGRGYGRERYDRGSRLTILGASYRSIDGRGCDAYSYVHRRCDGQQSCSVKSSNSICGDPQRGRLKVLEVAYRCGDQELRANVPEKSQSKLSCR